MSNAHIRRQAALEAIARVLAGTKARDAETELVDFKVELNSIDKSGHYVPVAPQYEPAAKALTIEASCFAHTEDGGVLVVGVMDKLAGPDAFVGSSLDTDWLRERILENSHKLLKLPEIETLQDASTAGKRIYLVDVPHSMEEVRLDGKLHGRKGRDCVEVTGDDARRLLEHRRRFDWSALWSGLRISHVSPAAVGVAANLYQTRHGRAPTGTRDLLSRLGLLRNPDDDDSELNNAGALLFCAYEPSQEQIVILQMRVEGTQSLRRLPLKAPLLVAFDETWKFLDDRFPARASMRGAARSDVRDIPEMALREAVVNALGHRDYEIRAATEVRVLGDPATALKVISPGGFPVGVTVDRLLSASKRRNPVLFNAMRTLGLGDQEGVGIDTMYRLLLRDGHAPPEITEQGPNVVCRLDGGSPDPVVRGFFDELEKKDVQAGDDVRATIAIAHLLQQRYITADQLETAAQCTRADAADALGRLEKADAIEPTPRYRSQLRLTAASQQRLASRLKYPSRVKADERWSQVEAYIKVHGQIDQTTLAKEASISRAQAGRLLGGYVRSGVLEVVVTGRYPKYGLPTRHSRTKK